MPKPKVSFVLSKKILLRGIKFALPLLLFFLIITSFSKGFVWAATTVPPKTSNVTLSIVDITPPSVPVLVSPGNGSYLVTGKPTFVWNIATDNRAISYYQFFLDGALLFNNLPTGNKETSDYLYVFDSVSGTYSLTFKNNITDGPHTWKVKVFDINNNSSESATWSFTVDTLAPSFVITQMGDTITAISAQDPSTVPATPVELEDNEPLLIATGEANSTVQITLTIPSDPTQNFTTTIAGDGTWSLQLGILPRDEAMTLDFVITDQAGLASVLSNLQFLIKPIVIIWPPASPTPSPDATPSPAPSSIPGIISTPTPSPTPEGTPTPPLIEIEITPPREVVIAAFAEIYEALPETVKNIIKLIPENVVQAAKDLAPISAAVVATTLPAASAAAMASQFGGNLSFSIFSKILQSLGLLPTGNPQGLVFNSQTYEPVPFAMVTIQSEQSNRIQTTDTVITDVRGVYRGVKLTPGMYRLTITHQEFTFPTLKKRPPYVQFKDYYMGEVFRVASEKQKQLFLIPVDSLEKNQKKSFKMRFKIMLSRFSRITQHLTFPLFFISGFLALIFPSLWNNLIFGLYSLMVLKKIVGSFKKPIIKGLVADMAGQPLMNAVVRIIEPETNELISVITTDESGKFKVFAPPNLYRIEVNLTDYVWQEEGEAAMSFHQVDVREKAQDLTIVLQSAEDIYKDLFG